MDIKLLNGNTVRLVLARYRRKVGGRSKSKFQHSVGDQLAVDYPHDNIYEEVFIPGERFFLDFFIPSISLVVECHGKQHVEHIRHFHKTKTEFHRQLDTDQRKRDWCTLNGFRFLEIYDE